MYSVDCMIIGFGFKDVPVFIIRDVLTIVTPFFNWIVFLFLYKIVMKSKLKK